MDYSRLARMTANGQDSPRNAGTSAPLDEEIPDDLRVRLALAEDALREDRKRMANYAQMVALFESVSPSDASQLLRGLSVQLIANFLSQIPQFSSSLTLWSEEYFKSSDSCGIAQDVRRLESLGVRREPMAVAMQAIKFSPFLDKSFSALGDKRKRRQRAKRLLGPVQDLRDLAKLFDDPPALVFRHIPDPSKIACELEFLSSSLSWGQFVYDSLGANHLLEVTKFGLASLVHEITGKFLDREVSYLICVALGDDGYDETRHRVWRIANYQRLQRNVPIVTRLLLALNSTVSRQE
jgi:hypothetical protein